MDIQELCFPPPLWCGGGVVLRKLQYIYICKHVCAFIYTCVYLFLCLELVESK